MTTATDMLNKYIAAETAILAGQQVRLDNRHLTMADLNFVQDGRKFWQRQVDSENRIAAGGSSMRFQTPDFS